MQISCPQCGKILEAPYPLPSLAKCPFCAGVFAPGPAAPQVPPPPGPVLAPLPIPSPRPAAADQIRTPAIGIMLAGALSFLWALFDLVACMVFLNDLRQGKAPPLPPVFANFVQLDETQLILEIGLDVIKLVTCSVVVLAALRMLQLRSYAVAITGSILSLIPCLTCCLCLGVPFGIWALVLLNRPEIRSSFNGTAPG